MDKKRFILYMLLLVPIVSSILSTIHIISLTSLGNPISMAIATAITYEISSIVSFIVSGVNKINVSKARLYFIFFVLFVLQCVGNTYSGFNFINDSLLDNPGYLNDISEMCFNVLAPAELKLSLSALIGIPLPLISLIMLKTALEYSESSEDNTGDNLATNDIVEEATRKEQDTAIESNPAIQIKQDAVEKPTIQAEPVKQKMEPVKKAEINNKAKVANSKSDRDPSDKNSI